MALNKFFTIMVVPEKSQQVRRLVVPAYVFKGAILAMVFFVVLATIMILDYANVMNQITENKQLKVENRQLRQSVQVFKNKMVTIENTLDRVKTFSTKLRIITNIEEAPGGGSSTLGSSVPAQAPVPAAAPVTAPAPAPAPAPANAPTPMQFDRTGTSIDETMLAPEPDTDVEETEPLNAAAAYGELREAAREKRRVLLAALTAPIDELLTMSDADTSIFVKAEFERLDTAWEEVNKFAIEQEREAQHILERLGEKRALLAGMPTRLPTLGYITSEYGVRLSPFDGRRKMHEGIDIANRYGADIIAPADAIVIFSGVKPGYGKVVKLDHGNGIETAFAHNSKMYVKAGDRVRRGQKIAAVGNTGHSTGSHCHYEVHANGLPVDPCWYVLDHPAACGKP